MKEKKHPNFQDLYSFADYKKAYDARSTFNCGLSPVCLSAPEQHYSIRSTALKEEKSHYACLNFRTLKLEYAIQVWLKAALISSDNPGPLKYYWGLHYEDNDTSFREVKYSKFDRDTTPEGVVEGFWKLLEEIANSGKIKVSEGYSFNNKTGKYISIPSIEFDVILDREQVRDAYKDFDDVYSHEYKCDKVSYTWDEIKSLFTQLTLKQLSLIDEDRVHKRRHVDEMLFTACDEQNFDAVKTAINMGADVNALDKYGESALQHLIDYFTEKGVLMDKEYSEEELEAIVQENYRKCVEIVDYLLEQGADIDLFGTDGIQPITCAYYAHSIDMIRHLLEKGSNPNYNSFRCDDVRWHSDDSHRCTILHDIGDLPYDEYDDYEEVEDIVRKYGGRRYAWDYDPYLCEHIGKYYLYMAPDCQNWLFFDNDGWGIGTESEVTIEDSEGNLKTIQLPHIEGLDEWHQDYHNNIMRDDFDWSEWNQRGRALAKTVAGILPDNAALFYPYGTEINREWNEFSKEYYLKKIREFILIEP